MKTAELKGALLRRSVALALGWKVERETADHMPEWRGDWAAEDPTGMPYSFTEYGFAPDLKWEQAGPIIDREVIGVYGNYVRDGSGRMNGWIAALPRGITETGPTPLVAAMRAFVASKLGPEVDLPQP